MTDSATTTPLEPEAFNELLAAWYVRPNTTAQAMKLTRDPDRAKDLVQDVAIRLMERRDQFAPGSNFMGWASTIMYHYFLSGWRRTKNRTMIEPSAPELAVELAMQVTPQQQSGMMARDMLRVFGEQCTQDEGRALLMHTLGNMTVEEIAATQGLEVGTIKSRMSRARRRMIKEYEREA